MGPDRVTPIYNSVVLINVDTVYASAFHDLTDGPMVLTVPETPVNYSILLLDPYGDSFQTALQPNTPGVYTLTGPGFSGALPPGIRPSASRCWRHDFCCSGARLSKSTPC